VNYVSVHDNETLFDTFMLKASLAADSVSPAV
jgi:pullulanase/glycogen debranching enzyme